MVERRWMSNRAILIEMVKLGRGREFKITRWRNDPIRSGNTDEPWVPYGVRHQIIEHSDLLSLWINTMCPKISDPFTIHIGTNLIDSTKLPNRPPILQVVNDSKARATWRETWNGLVDSSTDTPICGKSLVWDIDDPDDLEMAFESAEAIASILHDLSVKPRLVFSGSKGFHVWVVESDSCEDLIVDLIGVSRSDLLKANAKKRAAWHREVVKEVSRRAIGREIPHLDQAPNHRQGIIRCPYAIHEKTGQVVWPLDSKDLKLLRDGDVDWSNAVSLAASIHSWEIDVQSPLAEANGIDKTWIHPESTVVDRGLPIWNP